MNKEMKAMRDVFIDRIYERMHDDRKIFFLSADFGSPSLDRLRKKFKDRFLNVGIAEQNLINIATGLALEGFSVYAYAIAPFLTMRAYEQIRVNLSLHAQLKQININLIGVGAGLSYDVSGPTHHCLEDISIMMTLPNIDIFSPSDWVLAEEFFDYSLNIKKPKYMRLDSKPMPAIYKDKAKIDWGKGFCELKSGVKVCLIATGFMVHQALRAAENLRAENINIGVFDIFLLKPLNADSLLEALSKYEHVITLEEAFINKGGLDSLISAILGNKGQNKRLIRMGFNDRYVFEVGDRQYLHKRNNLDEGAIVSNIRKVYG